MAQARSNGITLEYEQAGPAGGEPLLLIHGVGAQLIRWPRSLCDALVAAGFHLIRFDNRDVGLSTHMGAADPPASGPAQAPPRASYTLSDMAADAVGLLDALGIDRAHLLGVSLGGMIAQTVAIEHPGRVRSMAIVMSHSGNPGLPASDPAALAALATPAPDPGVDEAAYVAHSVALNRTLGSPAYPTGEDVLGDFARAAAARAYDPAGAARQLAASRAHDDRRGALGQVRVPTLVIHGADDPIIRLAGGEDVARHVPEAWMLTIHGMGHDLPDALSGVIASTVAANARRAINANGPDAAR